MKDVSKQKKIAVMTLHYVKNYGSVLQAIATKEYLSGMGLDVIFINYIRDNVRNSKISISPDWSSNILKRTIYKAYRLIDTRLKMKVFDNYVKKNLELTEPFKSRAELYDREIDADIFCIGGDQMWNSEYNGGVLKEYFLSFVTGGKKKISFSTSMGMTSYDNKELKQMKELLNDFSFISVREKSAVQILENIGLRNVHQILDPTLLLSGEQWKKFIKRETKYKKYVLIYQFSDNPDAQKFARNLANGHKLSVLQITYNKSKHWDGIKSLYIPPIDEFISLIANADYVVTDSFHGTAFSINLNRDFYVFSSGKYSDRLYSILALTKLENHFVTDINTYVMPNAIDYKMVEDILLKWREEANVLIKNALITTFPNEWDYT